MAQLPVLHVDGHEMWQTIAMCRYLGKTFGLAGGTDMENAMMDIYVDGADELYNTYKNMALALFKEKDMDKFEAAKKDFIPSAFTKFCTKYEGFLKGDWIVGNKPSWADAVICEWLKRVEVIVDPHCLDSYPKLKAYNERFHAIPAIAEYIKNRPDCPL